jgi:anti-sigma factor (TIGR02949 family)
MSDLSQMCSFVMMRINALLDDELDDATADQVRNHLSECENCLDEIEVWSAIKAAVRRAYAPSPAPQSLIDKVTQNIRRLNPEPDRPA